MLTEQFDSTAFDKFLSSTSGMVYLWKKTLCGAFGLWIDQCWPLPDPVTFLFLATQAAAFLAAVYGTYVAPSSGGKSRKYLCWARTQTRCVLSASP